MKKLLIILGVIVLILGIGAYFLLAPAAADKAILYIESGDVQVNIGSGWQAASDEMNLKTGYGVKTLDGEASVVYLEGEVMHLEPQSEIIIDKVSGSKISVTQNAGETWNKVTKLSGIGEFEVKTPNTVATVRGTQFFLNLSHLSVLQGKVGYGTAQNPLQVQLTQMQRAIAGTWQVDEIPEADLARFGTFQSKYVVTLKKVREREIKKHSTILQQAEKKGYSWERIQSELAKIDNDKNPVEDKTYADTPFFLKKKAERTYKLTKEIKKAMYEQRPNLHPAGNTAAVQSNCENSGKCRIWAKCSERVDMLMIDGVSSGCIEADKAVSQGLDYCGHYTLENGNKRCNYQDKQIQHLCICP